MASGSYSFAEVRRHARPVNASEAIVYVFTNPLAFVLANYTPASPDAITLAGTASGLLGSWLFFTAHPAAAGIAYAIFFALDACDGTIARLAGRTSERGALLDFAGDRAVLLAGVLARAAVHLDGGQKTEAWLCAAYLAAHYATDLRSLLAFRRDAALREHRRPDLEEALREKLAARSDENARSRGLLQRLSAFELRIRPTAWTCNIAFLVAGCFVHDRRAELYAVALLAIVWSLVTDGLRAAWKRRAR